MGLDLITGPANAAKAGRLLDAAHAAAQDGALFVVPSATDADRYRRELVARGVVFGVDVITFSDLAERICGRAGMDAHPLGAIAREQVAASAAAKVRLRHLGASAQTAGFAEALARLCDELAEHDISPQWFSAALNEWAHGDRARSAYARELASLVRADTALLTGQGLTTEPQQLSRALAVLIAEPARWDARHVLFYGFDDLTAQQRRIVAALAGPLAAHVTLSLTYEHGRELFDARRELHGQLLGLGAVEHALPADDRYYDEPARASLGSLERVLLQPGGDPITDSSAITVLEGGSARAELELAAAEAAKAIARGVEPSEIAVVHRGLSGRVAEIERVFARFGIAVAARQRVRADQTPVGRGLLALLRIASGHAGATDLIAYLRTPGVAALEQVDTLERELRLGRVTEYASARDRWLRGGGADPLAQLTAVADGGRAAFCRALAARCAELVSLPWHGLGAELSAEERVGFAVAAELAAELRRLATLPDGLVPDATSLARMLAGLTVTTGAHASAGLVTVAEPQSLRARRVRVLFLLGLVDGVFPARGRPEPFLGDEERIAINTVSGLGLALHESAAVERLYLYLAVSRPTERLYLGWHRAGDDGKEAVRSHFADEILSRFAPGAEPSVLTRHQGAAGFPRALVGDSRVADQHDALAAPSRAPEQIAPLSAQPTLAALAERETFSASDIETWLSCPARWFVERHLGAGPLTPDPQQLVRGRLAHRVLELVVRELAAESGGPLSATDPQRRRALVAQALRDESQAIRVPVGAEQLQLELRRLEVDLVACLEQGAASGTSFRPAEFELAFGTRRSERPAVQIGDGERFGLSGIVDRVDLSPDGSEALIYDYKGRTAPEASHKWLESGRLQLLLYVQALRRLLGVHVSGAFYQPVKVAGSERPGVIEESSDPGHHVGQKERVPAEQLEEMLEQAAEIAGRVVGEIRGGHLAGTPATCSRSGCRYPSICRAQGAG